MGRTHATPSMRTRRALLALLAGLLGAAALVVGALREQLGVDPRLAARPARPAGASSGLGARSCVSHAQANAQSGHYDRPKSQCPPGMLLYAAPRRGPMQQGAAQRRAQQHLGQ